MAKKKEDNLETVNSKSVFDLVKSIDKEAEIIANSTYSNIENWISSGSYVLNACMGGSLFKGLPSGRIVTLAGPSGVGKSFLALSFCREAQKQGYTIVYLDSEAAQDKDFVTRLGCDPNNFIIKQVSTISETSNFIANLTKKLLEQKEQGEEIPKLILVLDSLGNLASDKEKTDTIDGNNKVDFTKNKDIRSLFRVNTTAIGKLQIPWIVVSHTYTSVSSFIPSESVSGGGGIKYNSSITLMLSAAMLKDDKENDKAAEKFVGNNVKKNGVVVTVTPDKSRFCRPQKVKFQIPFFKPINPYVGLEQYLNWDNAGILQGKCYTTEEYNKLKPNEQTDCIEFDFNNEKRYAQPKKTLTKGVGMVCKHLGKAVSLQEFYSSEVFTNEFLKKIDDEIIKPLFQLPDQNSFDDIEDLKESLNLDEDNNQ